jgi:small neutral amino acid transporter SnatA (MarC family)
VQLPALLIAAGLVLFFVAFQAVLVQFVWPAPPPPLLPEPSLAMALTPLALPATVTPYGLAVLVLPTAAAAGDRTRQMSIIGLFLLVMVINLVVLWFAPPVMKYLRTALLALAPLMSVLQMALAIEMIGVALRILGVLSPAVAGT